MFLPTLRMFGFCWSGFRPGGCSCHAVGLDLQSIPIEYKDFQSARHPDPVDVRSDVPDVQPSIVSDFRPSGCSAACRWPDLADVPCSAVCPTMEPLSTAVETHGDRLTRCTRATACRHGRAPSVATRATCAIASGATLSAGTVNLAAAQRKHTPQRPGAPHH